MKRCLLIMLVLLWSLPAAALVVDKDTLWTGEQSFTEDVRVMAGVTLTVAPGATVRFSGARLEINGRLLARDAEFSGESWEGLILKGSAAGSRLTNCVIKGAKVGIFVHGGAPLLDRLTLAGNHVGVELRGKAAGRISSCRFVGNRKVGLFIKDDSTTVVVDCRFDDNSRYGAYLYHARQRTFQGNVFVGNAIGLMIAYHGSDPEVSSNRFERNEIAIQVDRAAHPRIRGNLLRGNQTGIHAYRRSDPLVSGNRIEENGVGLLVAYSSYPRIEGNDFLANKMALKLEFQSSAWETRRGANARAGEALARSAFAGQGMRSVTEADRRAASLDGTVNARGNWWGDAGTAELNTIGLVGNPSFIYDGRDQATFVDAGEEFPLDKVTYGPWSDVSLTVVKP